MEIPVACEAVGIPAGGVAWVLVGMVPMDLPGWLVEISVACEGATVPAGGAAGVSVAGGVLAAVPVGCEGATVPAGGATGVSVACEESASSVSGWLISIGSPLPSVNTSKNASKP